jgi:hypothetical protein
MLWLMSCAFCTFVGFFIAEKGLLSVKSKTTAKAEIDPEIIKKAEREAWELNNMLTYDGTPQEQFKDY